MNYRTLITHVGEGGVIHEKDSVVVMPEVEANVLISHGLIAATPEEAEVVPEAIETVEIEPDVETTEKVQPVIKKAKPKKKKK